jgi:hypothetical protein
MFAKAYMGRKRWAQPNNRFRQSQATIRDGNSTHSQLQVQALARRPQHGAPAKQVNVKVIDCLATIRPGVDDRTETLR